MSTTFNNWIFYILLSLFIVLTSMYIEEHQEKLKDEIFKFINFSQDSQNQKTQQIQDILDYYQKKIKHIKQQKNQNVAFGYVADQDIFVDAIQLMKELGFPNPPQPKYHKEPNTTKEVSEVFAYFFSQGAGVELFVGDQNIFNNITLTSKKIMKKSEAGGNALAMAFRAYKEKVAQILLGAELNEEYFQNLFDSSINLTDIKPKKGDLQDIHLVLDYSINQTWGNLSTPRSNRMYLNHDTINPNFGKMADLHQLIIDKYPDTQILALSGFQFQNERQDHLKEKLLQQMMQNITETQKLGTKIHIEMATITDSTLLYQMTKYGIQIADSIGMNEQELYNLIEFMINNQTIQVAKAEASDVNQLISDIVKYFAMTQKVQFNINRIHFHTLNMQMICSSYQDWDKPENSLIKSIIVALLMSHELNDDFTEFETLKDLELDYPEELQLLKLDGLKETQQFLQKQPVNCWEISQEFQCCVAPNLFTKNPKRTCGLGDNISSTGLIYQKINPNQSQSSQ